MPRRSSTRWLTLVDRLDEIIDQVAALRVANAGLRQVIEAKDSAIRVLPGPVEALPAHVAELRARSGLAELVEAPSSERLARPAPRSLRRRSGRKPGLPKGRPGSDAGDDRSPCGA